MRLEEGWIKTLKRFKLEIELGNEEMQSPEHVADALEHLAEVLRENSENVLRNEKQSIFDVNGNDVGYWRFQ